MQFIDFCAGIGGFRLGFEMECIGFAEYDKFARKSYKAMYDTEGEWEKHDIREIKAEEIPRADCWLFGFPCQDISTAGKQAGVGGVQSRLFFTIMRLLEECPKENKPKFVIAENVKNLLSIGRGFDFARVLLEMGKAGCNRIEWQVLNSKNFGVPQNRERIIIVGYLGNGCPRKIFPFRGEIVNVVKQIANISTRRNRRNPSQGRCYSTKGIAPTLCGNSGGQLQPCIFVKDVCRLGGGNSSRSIHRFKLSEAVFNESCKMFKSKICCRYYKFSGRQQWFNISGVIAKNKPFLVDTFCALTATYSRGLSLTAQCGKPGVVVWK